MHHFIDLSAEPPFLLQSRQSPPLCFLSVGSSVKQPTGKTHLQLAEVQFPLAAVAPTAGMAAGTSRVGACTF